MMIDFKNTLLLGHRGARHEAPENTLFGFQHAQRLQPYGLSGIECDVQLTHDGQLIVFHDDTLQRLCRAQARIDQLNLVEIQRHLPLGHPIITLDDLLQYLSAHSSNPLAQTRGAFSHIEIEIKTHERTNYLKMARALSRYLTDSPRASLPLVLTSFDTQLLALLQRDTLLSRLPRGLLIRDSHSLMSAPHTALQLGCRRLGIYYPLLNQTLIRYYHRYGLPVSAWTVNDIAALKQLIHWQVDTIITDIPSQLLKP